ncbi:ligninase H2 [Sporothrix schenckii 1099-18]|uniref:Peroxidase n=1 Tax=Sporothrix schenckii 1099-18 TaxID=1397361 RepID=A0A0F2M3G2_SPOSC|nr:ligninase H2 [Sporothrix schenckii 1099-18]KJR83649.1 ligninase H2 [Sporothrix schenckii 1099-18]
MKLAHLVTIWITIYGCNAYPGMGQGRLKDILNMRGDDNTNQVEMIGDLTSLADHELSDVGRSVKNILQGKDSPEDVTSTYTNVPAKDSQQCASDPCCIWEYIKRDMYAKFHGDSGRCTKHARAAVRLGFHDAASWEKGDTFGGADGSIVLANELTRAENDGLQDIGIIVQGWYDTYHSRYGVGMADLIQMGATIATVTCPLGPRIRSYVGRKDSSQATNKGRMPDVHASAENLVALFQNKTITPEALVALVGAHTTSQQHFVDETRDGAPQDSSPGVWDILFYGETKSATVPPRVFRFPSDIALSKHESTAATWNTFSTAAGQAAWNNDFAREYIRMSMLGVNNINDLTECTKVLPMPTTSFKPPDQEALQQWLQGKDTPKKDAGAALEDGKALTLVQGVLGVVGDVGDAVGGIVGGIGGIIGGIGDGIGGLIGGLLP